MNQPDLGLKVAEARQQKGFTQEQLAELCDVSARTIQRIECGEVEPRSFTRNNLARVLEFDFGEDNTQNETLWLVVMHLSSMLSNIIIPLVIWSWKKRASSRIDRHGRDVLNFQITTTLMLFAASLYILVVVPAMLIISGQSASGIGPCQIVLASLSVLPFIAIGIFCTVEAIINTIRVLSDRPHKYLFSIPFLR